MKLKLPAYFYLFLIISTTCLETKIKSLSKNKTKSKMYFLMHVIARVALKIIIRIATRGLFRRFFNYSARKLVRRLAKYGRRYSVNRRVQRFYHRKTKYYFKKAKRNNACKKASLHLSNYYKSYFRNSTHKIIHLLKALFQAGKCAYQIGNRKIGKRLINTFRKLKRSQSLRRIVKKLRKKHLRKLKRINKARSLRSLNRVIKINSRTLNSYMRRLIRKSPHSAIQVIKIKETIRRGVRFIRRIISLAN